MKGSARRSCAWNCACTVVLREVTEDEAISRKIAHFALSAKTGRPVGPWGLERSTLRLDRPCLGLGPLAPQPWIQGLYRPSSELGLAPRFQRNAVELLENPVVSAKQGWGSRLSGQSVAFRQRQEAEALQTPREFEGAVRGAAAHGVRRHAAAV